jgi:hypothetical protein
MAPNRADLNYALREYWAIKQKQGDAAVARASTAEGNSIKTRGGKHFQPIVDLLAGFFLDAGYPEQDIGASGGLTTLPGFYRGTKDWDLVVINGGVLVAAIELKALGAPSFSNNYNNRIEEALGNAVDVARASRAALAGPEAPWLGYFFVMEDAVESRRPVPEKSRNPVIPVSDEWLGLSFQERFMLTGERFLDDRLYDAVCYLISSPADPTPKESSPRLDWDHFSAAIQARISFLAGLGYPK